MANVVKFVKHNVMFKKVYILGQNKIDKTKLHNFYNVK